MTDTDTFQKILTLAGYEGEATHKNVVDCFLNYCDVGAFHDLDYDSAVRDIADGDITINDICRSMLNVL